MKSESGQTKFISTERCQKVNGFSLLEVMVAMVIFLIVTAAIFGLLQAGRVDRSRSNNRTDMLKNARVALHLIGRDALNAGLSYHKRGGVVPDDFISTRFGNPVDANDDKDFLTSLVGGNDRLTNDLIINSTDKTDTVVFAFRDLDFNNGDVIELQSVAAVGGDPTSARVTTKSATGAANIAVHDLYLLESTNTQVAVMATSTNNINQVDFKPGDPLGLNLPFNGTGKFSNLLKPCLTPDQGDCMNYAKFAALKRFFLVSYKIKQDGTLVRITYGNNRGKLPAEQIVEQPLAYNVENMQFKYVMEDGVVTENPLTGPDGILNTADDDPLFFNKVRQITVTLKIQSAEIDEKTRKPETVVLTGTFATRNLEYDAG